MCGASRKTSTQHSHPRTATFHSGDMFVLRSQVFVVGGLMSPSIRYLDEPHADLWSWCVCEREPTGFDSFAHLRITFEPVCCT